MTGREYVVVARGRVVDGQVTLTRAEGRYRRLTRAQLRRLAQRLTEYADRALPSWAVDLIRDGAKPEAVLSALVRTAMSARTRGWPRWEWEGLVSESKLGRQLQSWKSGPEAALDRAWTYASSNVDQHPTTPPEPVDPAVLAAAIERARATAEELRPADAAVLRYAADEHERRGWIGVALPRRAVAAATGLGEDSVRGALDRLARDGHLQVQSRGFGGARTRRAAVYALPCGATPPCSPPLKDMGGM